MRKALIILAAAAAAASAWATDTDPAEAKARGTNPLSEGGMGPPHTLNGREGLGKLLDAFGCDNYEKIDWNDDWWWLYKNDVEKKKFPYMIFRFQEPEGYDGGTCHWEIKVASGADVYIWRWDYAEQEWDYVMHNDGGSNPGEETFDVPPSWFSGQGVLRILADTANYITGDPNWSISCDRMDIQW